MIYGYVNITNHAAWLLIFNLVVCLKFVLQRILSHCQTEVRRKKVFLTAEIKKIVEILLYVVALKLYLNYFFMKVMMDKMDENMK